MPLPRPILDDRSYEQLRDELVRRIPVYTREWTDHNPSDPGITLLELFSYLGENLLYRFNQIPETTRLEFLRLLQIPLRPAQPSRARTSICRSTLCPIQISDVGVIAARTITGSDSFANVLRGRLRDTSINRDTKSDDIY